MIPRHRIAEEVLEERKRQDGLWGEQNHQDGTGGIDFERACDRIREECVAAFNTGRGTWRHILLEEVAEACAEHDPSRIREELVQVSAVAQAWIEAIDRRLARSTAVACGTGGGI